MRVKLNLRVHDLSDREQVILFSLLNGLHSGIPLCCILYFVGMTQQGIALVARHAAKTRGGHGNAPYVQCNECFNTGRVQRIKFNGAIATELLE